MQDVREPDRRDATFAVGGGGTGARIAGGCGGCQVLRARASISVFRQSDRDSVIIEIEGGSGDFIHSMRRKVRGGEARGSGELFWVSSFSILELSWVNLGLEQIVASSVSTWPIFLWKLCLQINLHAFTTDRIIARSGGGSNGMMRSHCLTPAWKTATHYLRLKKF